MWNKCVKCRELKEELLTLLTGLSSRTSRFLFDTVQSPTRRIQIYLFIFTEKIRAAVRREWKLCPRICSRQICWSISHQRCRARQNRVVPENNTHGGHSQKHWILPIVEERWFESDVHCITCTFPILLIHAISSIHVTTFPHSGGR